MELLIVVVVIAILAAITIVSYNGITNRAKASAASSAAEQAAKRVMTYAITNADQFPAELSDAGLTDSSAAYQYRVDNTANPKTFCITATTQNVSYYVSSTVTSPTAGACAGHGANGGETITNLWHNPGPTAVGLANDRFQWGPAGSTGNATTLDAGTVLVTTAGSADGGIARSGNWGNASANLSPGTYRLSFNLTRKAGLGVPSIIAWFYNSAGAVISNPTFSGTESGGRASYAITAPGGTVRAVMQVSSATNANSAGDWYRISRTSLTTGSSTVGYGDGNSSGWTWNGTPNASSSTGPTP